MITCSCVFLCRSENEEFLQVALCSNSARLGSLSGENNLSVDNVDRVEWKNLKNRPWIGWEQPLVSSSSPYPHYKLSPPSCCSCSSLLLPPCFPCSYYSLMLFPCLSLSLTCLHNRGCSSASREPFSDLTGPSLIKSVFSSTNLGVHFYCCVLKYETRWLFLPSHRSTHIYCFKLQLSWRSSDASHLSEQTVDAKHLFATGPRTMAGGKESGQSKTGCRLIWEYCQYLIANIRIIWIFCYIRPRTEHVVGCGVGCGLK